MFTYQFLTKFHIAPHASNTCWCYIDAGNRIYFNQNQTTTYKSTNKNPHNKFILPLFHKISELMFPIFLVSEVTFFVNSS